VHLRFFHQRLKNTSKRRKAPRRYAQIKNPADWHREDLRYLRFSISGYLREAFHSLYQVSDMQLFEKKLKKNQKKLAKAGNIFNLYIP
jgi:hypothetical protein